MNRTFAVAIVAAVVGAAAAAVAFYCTTIAFAPKPLIVCATGQHCRPVSVVIVAGAAQIQSISDEYFKEHGVMQWEMDAPTAAAGYYFPADGINFYPTTPKASPHQAPANEFTGCKAMPPGQTNPTKFQCDNAHHTNGSWGYTVTVNSGSAPVPTPLDPYIVNG